MQRLLAVGLSVLLAAAAAADDTHWQADPSQPGNWFLPENWTAGVPGDTDWAYVQNGGTAVIGIRTVPGDPDAGDMTDSDASRGATAMTLEIGGRRGGAISQVWLHADFTHGLYIGARANLPAAYKLDRGSLAAGRIQVGRDYGVGEFTQAGGAAKTERLAVGDWPIYPIGPTPPIGPRPDVTQTAGAVDLYLPPSRFALAGGEFHAGAAAIGATGRGRAVLEGGMLTVHDLLTVGGPRPWPPIDGPVLMDAEPVDPPTGEATVSVYVPPPPPSDGRLDISGGRHEARRVHVGRTGAVVQKGGGLRTHFLAIDRGGTWTYAGGRLAIADGITCDGVLDFAGEATGLKAHHGVFNFGRGKLADTGDAFMALGRESLAIFPRGFNPYKEFGHFESAGIVHHAGRPLHISRRRGVVGWGRIDDFTVVHGYLLAAAGPTDDTAYPPYPAGIDLENGLAVRGGKVDLGRGTLQVRDWRSGVTRGGLRARRMVVGRGLAGQPVPVDALAEEAARNVAEAALHRHHRRPWPSGRFTQWSGDVRLDHLAVTEGLYLLRRGTLEADRAEVGGPAWGPGLATYIQHGGQAAFGSLHVGRYMPVRIATNGPAPHDITDPLCLAETVALPDDAVPWPCPPHSRVYVAGGRLKAKSITLMGWGDRASFSQTGGRVATDRLRIDGQATYGLFGGGLTAGCLEVGSPYPTHASSRLATLALMSPVADVHVTERMVLGRGSRLRVRSGAAVRLTGTSDDTGSVRPTTFDILSTDERALAGLNNLALVFEGGTDGWSTLEVAGVDYGFSNQGFDLNFALEELHVGGEEAAALLRLVDLVDNQPDSSGAEALYVDRLFITEGSCLDPAGLNIYYHEGHFPDAGGLYVGGDDDGNGGRGGLMLMPEPATLALLAAGIGLLVQRRRRG
ncbi:MAG: PEP-CTERM sorting domain-containing protein [Phycisphaerae bacterium]